MKTFITALLAGLFLTVSTAVTAAPRHHGHHHFHNRHHFHHFPNRHWHPHWGWIVPGAIIGGATVYYLERPWTRIEPVPNIVEQQTVCSEWREIQQPDGTILRERLCGSQN